MSVFVRARPVRSCSSVPLWREISREWEPVPSCNSGLWCRSLGNPAGVLGRNRDWETGAPRCILPRAATVATRRRIGGLTEMTNRHALTHLGGRGRRLRRRELMLLLGGAMSASRTLRAQQTAMPVIGFLSSISPGPTAPYMAAFHQGLSETGYVEGRNVTIEYRWADGH